jgi:hypothetical protein
MSAVERSRDLAVLSAAGLYGEARVRMDVGFQIDEPNRTILTDAASEVGAAVTRIFTSLLLKEFGAEGFSVRLVTADPMGLCAERVGSFDGGQ